MILAFRCAETEVLYREGRSRKIPSTIQHISRRKLRQLDMAGRLDDLRVPPGNRLEPLFGDRKGQHSIRINDQYRICFVWTDRGATEVEIVDYH